MTHRRTGMTTIELLTAIGIVMILAAIVVYGLRGTADRAKAHQTESTLENLKGLLKEYDLATKFTQGPTVFWNNGAVESVSNGLFWKNPLGNDDPFEAPGQVEEGTQGRLGDGTRNMRLAMMIMRSIPSNRTAIENLPKDQIMTFAGKDNLEPADIVNVPVPLDGWSNPIIFVPSAGMEVAVSGGSTTVRSPDNRPFFASAGPDGHFSGARDDKYFAEDNIYSFEK